MENTIKIPVFCFTQGKIFNNDYFEVKPGITAFVGCNGYGKTTSIFCIKQYCKKHNIPCLSYNNMDDNIRQSKQESLIKGDITTLATLALSSESETTVVCLGKFMEKVGSVTKKLKRNSTLFVVIDGCDSGMDVAVASIISDVFKNIAQDIQTKHNLYFIVSVNTYAMAKNFDCLDTINNEYVTFNNYENYVSFIENTYKIKHNRQI